MRFQQASLHLAATLLLLAACGKPSAALFGFGDDSEWINDATRPITSYNTVTVRTAYALQFLKGAFDTTAIRSASLPFGSGGQVAMHQSQPNEVVLVFSHSALTTDGWGSSTKQVPFLKEWVYTSEAPAALVDAWQPLSNGTGGASADGVVAPSTAGALADAIATFMGGEQVVRMVCVGEGAAGGLALLCGPWAGLRFPMANADVVTFGTPWDGFSSPFAWSFEQLVVVHYLWPFAAPAMGNSTMLAAAQALNPLVTKDVLAGAVVPPNLPPYAPAGLQDPGDMSFDEVYAALGPDASLPAEYQMPDSDCPVMFCKTRPLLKASCLGFDNGTFLGNLPYRILTDDRTDADAIVLWDDESKTAHFLWKYTEESRDWFTDANGIQREGFIEDCENIQAAGVHTDKSDSLTQMTGEVEVHAGFYNQFKSLAINPDRPEDNILLQLSEISGGQAPRRVTCSGFSLGGALSELCGVWASIQWPGVDVLVANQGGPIPGNEEFKLAFQATVGRAYKYVYRMDLVPSTAPFPWYERDPASIWINGSTALLQDRPEWGIGQLSWDDHTCDVWTNTKADPPYIIVGYVPRLYNITRPSIPAWVFNATSSVNGAGLAGVLLPLAALLSLLCLL
ncbi:hypothetical protein ABPG75_012092 [Micractinium tetrahymenae]